MKAALTGGIGSGKSTVARMLGARGAFVVDADALAREVVAVGTPGLAAVVAEFGGSVLGQDGALDRAALAALVFADPERRRALEAIVHPLVAERSVQLLAAAPSDAVVVYDVPLLAEAGAGDREFDAVVVVEAPVDLRLERLAGRGMSEADSRARMAGQADDEQRRAIADHVLVNDGDLESLEVQVDALWRELTSVGPAARDV